MTTETRRIGLHRAHKRGQTTLTRHEGITRVGNLGHFLFLDSDMFGQFFGKFALNLFTYVKNSSKKTGFRSNKSRHFFLKTRYHYTIKKLHMK